MIAAADLKNVLGSVNVNVADDDLNRLIESLKGKDINKLIASGISKIGGSGSAPVAGNTKAAKPAAE
jgi:ribosomal protein L12E/L44/L45/RPP1/RPP2